MNRKNFISAVLGSAALPLAVQAQHALAPGALEEPARRIPPYLKAGDVIGITCPAGFITPEDILPAVKQLEAWGFAVRVGETVGKRYHTFGGTDEERAGDFQQLMDDRSVKAILCARGGYGMGRIIDRLDFKKFAQQPKWIIGFSDVTVLHSHFSNLGIASVHSKMCNSFPKDPALAEPVQAETILSIRKVLTGEKMRYTAPAGSRNRIGIATGELTGGNLKILETLSGTPSACHTDGRILFVEDTGEYLYSIDRMFWNLKRSGRLSRLKGLIVGGFKIKPDEPGEEFGRSLEDIVLDAVKAYSYPVCFGFPVGHQKNNFALKCLVRHRLEVNENGVVLAEG